MPGAHTKSFTLRENHSLPITAHFSFEKAITQRVARSDLSLFFFLLNARAHCSNKCFKLGARFEREQKFLEFFPKGNLSDFNNAVKATEAKKKKIKGFECVTNGDTENAKHGGKRILDALRNKSKMK